MSRVINSLIGGFVLLMLWKQYGWWAIPVTCLCLILGAVFFELIAYFYIERWRRR